MDEEIAGMDVAVGAVGSGGERRSSTLPTAQDDGASQHWRPVSGGAFRASGTWCCG